MIKRSIKQAFKFFFRGKVFPVFSSQLKGIRLRVDPLMPGGLFLNNVEREVHYAYKIFIKPGDKIYDIGANVGLHSYHIAKKFKATTLFTFEPLPLNSSYIKEMISLNHFYNINVVEKAVGALNGFSFFDTSKTNHEGHVTETPTNLKVEVITLDQFSFEKKISPNVVKIDVEGHESEVLKGFVRTIKTATPYIVIEIHNSSQGNLIAEFFRPLNYTLYKLKHFKRRIEKLPFGKINPEYKNAHDRLVGQFVAIPNSKIKPFLDLIE